MLMFVCLELVWSWRPTFTTTFFPPPWVFQLDPFPDLLSACWGSTGVGSKETGGMSSWEGHGCPDVRQSSEHIIKASKNGRRDFSSNCPVAEEEVCVQLILIDFCISVVFLGFLYHSKEYIVLAGRCICCFPWPCKIILLWCGGFFCSMVVYLLCCKKCSLQPLGYLSTKLVFMRAENMAELQVSFCISQPTEQKGN